MLSNAYFLAKFRFDTAENEPAKKLQNFAKFVSQVELTSLALDDAYAILRAFKWDVSAAQEAWFEDAARTRKRAGLLASDPPAAATPESITCPICFCLG